MSSYVAKPLNEDTVPDWRALIQLTKEGSIYHDLPWMRLLERSFGLRPRCFLIYKDERPVALCPFFERKIRGISGLYSLPESDLSYILLQDPSDSDAIAAIVRETLSMVKENKLGYVRVATAQGELMPLLERQVSTSGHNMMPHPITGYMMLDLSATDPQTIWEKVFTQKDAQRKYIRRFEKEGYLIRETRAKEDVDRFYEYYSINLRSKDASPYERDHFDQLLATYPEGEMRLTLLEKGEEMAAGLITLHFPLKGIAYIRYSAPNKDMANNHLRRANLPLYWDAINHAYGLGYRTVCFGSTPEDRSNHSFQIKAGFGCVYHQAHAGMVPISLLFSTLYKTYRMVESVRDG